VFRVGREKGETGGQRNQHDPDKLIWRRDRVERYDDIGYASSR
jgi:hypothetical protein